MRTVKLLTALLFLFFLLNHHLLGQVSVSFRYGNADYTMNKLKKFNDIALSVLPVNAKVVADFPNTGFYEGNLMYNFKYIYLGASYTYHSTGSRISYRDYSGEILIDQTVTANAFGPIVKFKFNRNHPLNLNPYISTNITSTKYQLEETYQVFDDENNLDNKLTSSAIMLNLGLEVLYNIKFLGLGAFVGYSVDTKGNFYYEGNEVSLEDGSSFYPDWAGLRFGLQINILLSKRAKELDE